MNTRLSASPSFQARGLRGSIHTEQKALPSGGGAASVFKQEFFTDGAAPATVSSARRVRHFATSASQCQQERL